MDKVIENFIEVLKSKPPKDHAIMDLEVYIEELPVFYRYCPDEETCKILEKMYIVMIDYINEKRKFIQYRKSYLADIKKQKQSGKWKYIKD